MKNFIESLKKPLFKRKDELWKILYNNSLNFNLKQTMDNINDLIYNIQNMKQLQLNIDECQKLKDGVQLQIDMVCLALLRRYILDKPVVGSILFRILIRKYYPLNDEQILKYEKSLYKGVHKVVEKGKFATDPREWYYITNYSVLRRKGEEFSIGDKLYKLCYKRFRTTVNTYDVSPSSLISEIHFLKELSVVESNIRGWHRMTFLSSNYCVDFDDTIQINGRLAKNEFIKWDWDLINKIRSIESDFCWLEDLLNNNGFFFQMGAGNITETLTRLQNIVGTEFLIAKDVWNNVIERYKKMGVGLYAYSDSMSYEFIIEHQNDLDWFVLQRNPYIQWDLPLINLFLEKCINNIPESEWDKYLYGSFAMYSAIEKLLNDSILRDIEKLYNL